MLKLIVSLTGAAGFSTVVSYLMSAKDEMACAATKAHPSPLHTQLTDPNCYSPLGFAPDPAFRNGTVALVMVVGLFGPLIINWLEKRGH